MLAIDLGATNLRIRRSKQGRCRDAPDFPTFVDGHRANVLGDAVAASVCDRQWVEVPT
jgi:hypothetical protein